MWLKHPRSGEKDTMLTLSVFAFLACVFKFLGNGIVIGPVDLGTVDATLIGAMLAPTLVAYTARKFKSPPPDKKER
jgi:hypothetical protein